MKIKNYTEKYDDSFQCIGGEEDGWYSDLYHPQMMPWVGKEYGNGCKKLLIIGESAYAPTLEDYKEYCGVDEWYNNPSFYDKGDIYSNTYIREILNDYPFAGRPIYTNINSWLDYEKRADNNFRFVAYYNYFIRPAEPKRSLNIQDTDRNNSSHIFDEIYKIIEPELIFFISKLAYDVFNSCKKDIDAQIEWANHPSNRNTNTQKKFKAFIENNNFWK